MTKPDGERIVALEVQLIDLGKKVDSVGIDVKEIKDKVSTELLDHKQFEDRLIRLEAGAVFWRWVVPTMSAVAGSVLTFLLIEYLKKH